MAPFVNLAFSFKYISKGTAFTVFLKNIHVAGYKVSAFDKNSGMTKKQEYFSLWLALVIISSMLIPQKLV